MRALLPIALLLAAVLVPAEAAAHSADARTVAVAENPVLKSLPMPAATPPKAPEPQKKPLAAVAVTLTDDADSTLLPAFASRTTPLPTRLLRVGIEWSF